MNDRANGNGNGDYKKLIMWMLATSATIIIAISLAFMSGTGARLGTLEEKYAKVQVLEARTEMLENRLGRIENKLDKVIEYMKQ